MYVKLQNGQLDRFPYTIADLRRDNPGISFPDVINDEMLVEHEVYKVTDIPAPTYDSKTQRLTNSPHHVNGAWLQVWNVENLPDDQASNNVRSERNSRLADCDWTQLPDAPVDTTVWATYRQELRDITLQDGFPYEITWPEKP